MWRSKNRVIYKAKEILKIKDWKKLSFPCQKVLRSEFNRERIVGVKGEKGRIYHGVCGRRRRIGHGRNFSCILRR